MKLYFDNRDGHDAYITVFCDNTEFGRVETKQDTVTAVDIPVHTKCIRISATEEWSPPFFEDITTSSEHKNTFSTLKSEEIENFNTSFVREYKKLDVSLFTAKWQYAYDLEICIDGTETDLVMYQTLFPHKELENVIRYGVYTREKNELMKSRYIKRLKSFNSKRTIRFVICILVVLLLLMCIYLPAAFKGLGESDVFYEQKGYFGTILACIMGLCIGPIFLKDAIMGNGVLDEKKLKSEYYLDSDGNWSSSEK